jgi:hypothetical protein
MFYDYEMCTLSDIRLLQGSICDNLYIDPYVVSRVGNNNYK